ncbi:TetR family transcriptional regulator [Neptunitalea chrysea]|uniref:TetR family transcriptional regulator n=1 Tax=Neptunitalea chrysea TaxID=1647581 RepID=A0A9W6ETU3_9FLAO|nr:TetR/AcrR family transcriptional regulator [Neptunitalea chrysea]GLB52565.1 TetR family transcriptional regulator [Neptunitalea chrysea]
METFFVSKVSITIFVPDMENKIIERALDLFLNLGFKNVTMDEIAKETGISKKTIYQFFENKNTLILACLNSMTLEINKNISFVKEKNYNAVVEQMEVKKLIMRQLKSEKTSPHYQLQKYYPKIYANVRSRHKEIMSTCVADNLAKGIKEGLYRKEINIDIVTKIHFICAIEIKNEDHFPPEKYSVLEIMNTYTENFLRSMVTTKGLEILEQQLKQQ